MACQMQARAGFTHSYLQNQNTIPYMLHHVYLHVDDMNRCFAAGRNVVGLARLGTSLLLCADGSRLYARETQSGQGCSDPLWQTGPDKGVSMPCFC